MSSTQPRQPVQWGRHNKDRVQADPDYKLVMGAITGCTRGRGSSMPDSSSPTQVFTNVPFIPALIVVYLYINSSPAIAHAVRRAEHGRPVAAIPTPVDGSARWCPSRSSKSSMNNWCNCSWWYRRQGGGQRRQPGQRSEGRQPAVKPRCALRGAVGALTTGSTSTQFRLSDVLSVTSSWIPSGMPS